MATTKAKSTKTTNNGLKLQDLDYKEHPYAELKYFKVVTTSPKPHTLYGIINKSTGVCELVFNQLAGAVINMQTMEQTLGRVKSGEAHGFFVPEEKVG